MAGPRGWLPAQRSYTALHGGVGWGWGWRGSLLARLPPVRDRESAGKRMPTAAKVEMQREMASVRKAVTGCIVCSLRWCCSVGDPSTSLLISAQ